MQNTIKQRFDLQYMAHIMNTTYRHTKQVTRMLATCSQGVAKVYPRCSQALGRLMSMLRVCLGYTYTYRTGGQTPCACFSRRNTPFLLEKHCVSLGETLCSSVWTHSKELLLSTEGQTPCAMMNDKGQRTERLGNHFMTSCSKGVHTLRYVLVLVMMMGVGEMWGQPDGVYNIANWFQYNSASTTTTNWYLVPTQAPSADSQNKNRDIYYSSDGYSTAGSAETPFITTYQTYNQTESNPNPYKPAWIIQSVPNQSGYYYIIHALTGKYIVYEPPYTNNDYWRRKSVHLQETNSPGSNAIFKIITSTFDGEYYNIIPKSLENNDSYRFLNPAGDNANNYRANSEGSNPKFYLGLVGVYNKVNKVGNDDGRNSNWYFENTLLSAPTINVDANNKVTVTENNGLPAGYNIRYTFGDGSQEPTATTEPYITNDGSENEIPITSSGTLKVVIERYGVVLTGVAEEVINLIPSPTITYNTSNLIEMATNLEGASIYYTTDGSEPSVINGRRYQNPFDPADDVTEIKAIVIAPNGETSIVTTFTPPVLLGQNHIRLIQNQGNAWTCDEHPGGHFYMRPTTGDNLSTTSLFLSDIQWYFLNAGENAGDQYYYLVHDDKRLCYDEGNVKLKTFDSDNADKFKFRLVAYPETGTTTDYNIVPYELTEGSMYVTKPNGNGAAAVIALGNSNSDGNARWKFILPSSFDHTAPFTVSNDNQSYFYKIGNGENYIIQSSETAVATSNSTDPEVVKTGSWMMMLVPDTEISVGDEFTYYNIRNAKTNDYLYYTGGETPGFAVSATVTEGQEDKYRFTWARSTATDTYYLIPRTQVESAKSSIIGFSPYTITAAPGFVLDPVLTMDADGIVTMTCATSGSEIFYRIDGDYTDETGAKTATNPIIPAESGKKPTLPTRLYSTDFLLSLDATQVRAVAVLKNDHNVKSAVQLINLTQCGKPNPTDENFHDAQGSLTIPKVKVGTVGEGDDEHDVYADIYYTIDGTNPALVETTPHGVEPEIVFQYNSRSKVWAVAAKNGMRKSEAYQMDVVYMPTITFQQESYTYSATITDSKIVSQAIEPVITNVQVEGEEDPIATTDYHVMGYRDNTEAGTGKIIIKATPEAPIKLYGIGNFTINKAPLSSITVDKTSFTYNYRAQGPEITSIKATGGNGDIGLLGFDAYYTVTDNLQVSAGEYTLRVEAKEGTNFTGYVDKAFTIKSKSLKSDDIYITVKKEVSGNTVTYVPTLKDGSVTLVEDKDYTYTVDTTNGIILTFTGKGNYSSAAADKREYVFIDLPFVRPENSTAEYAALYVTSSADLTTPLGMTAYIVTGVTNKDRVLLEEVTYIPKDVPVLMLSGKRADGFGKVVKTGDTYTEDELSAINTKNKLSVNTSATEIEAALIYLFYKGEFVLNAKGTLPAGKVYLDLRDTSNPTPAPRLYIVGGDGNTTEIEDVRYKEEEVQNDRWFTLDGRMLQGKPTQKGRYSKNGRKVVIR